jgi:hypothetical protein
MLVDTIIISLVIVTSGWQIERTIKAEAEKQRQHIKQETDRLLTSLTTIQVDTAMIAEKYWRS